MSAAAGPRPAWSRSIRASAASSSQGVLRVAVAVQDHRVARAREAACQRRREPPGRRGQLRHGPGRPALPLCSDAGAPPAGRSRASPEPVVASSGWRCSVGDRTAELVRSPPASRSALSWAQCAPGSGWSTSRSARGTSRATAGARERPEPRQPGCGPLVPCRPARPASTVPGAYAFPYPTRGAGGVHGAQRHATVPGCTRPARSTRPGRPGPPGRRASRSAGRSGSSTTPRGRSRSAPRTRSGPAGTAAGQGGPVLPVRLVGGEERAGGDEMLGAALQEQPVGHPQALADPVLRPADLAPRTGSGPSTPISPARYGPHRGDIQQLVPRRQQRVGGEAGRGSGGAACQHLTRSHPGRGSAPVVRLTRSSPRPGRRSRRSGPGPVAAGGQPGAGDAGQVGRQDRADDVGV